MRTLSIDVSRLTNVLLALFILQFATTVQGRTYRSLEIDDTILNPINLPESPNIIPRQLSSPNNKYRISGLNNLEMVPGQLSPSKIEDREPSADYLAGRLPDSWRAIPSWLEPPRIEIQLFKGYVSKRRNCGTSVEYKFSDNHENVQPKSDDRNAANGTEVRKGYQDKTTSRKPSNFGLDSRTIFQVPRRQCAPGEMRDQQGKCRQNLPNFFDD